jgi:hypothetical protein
LQDDNKLLEQKTCNKSVELNNLVTSCQQAVDNLSTSWEQAVRTHPVDKLLEQNCHKSAAGLLQLVRFYVCKIDGQHLCSLHKIGENQLEKWLSENVETSKCHKRPMLQCNKQSF